MFNKDKIMKAQLNTLKLVYPPVSNQYAEKIKDDKEIRESLKDSNLYMIVQRPEAKFSINKNEAFDEENSLLKIQLIVEGIVDDFEIDLLKLYEVHNFNINEYDVSIQFNVKEIKFWKVDSTTGELIDVINWFTTEKILWDKWNRHPAIIGLEKVDLFSRFYLHYVGISKEEDSLTRLVVKPHDKRLRILSNEYNMSDNSRLTDELILLFLKIEEVRIQVWKEEDDSLEFIKGRAIDKKDLIADAEKAFINILNSKYNQQKYKNYPKGKDGIYNEGLTGYSYCIGESLTLVTDDTEISGESCPFDLYQNSDSIVITGDNVELLKTN